MLLYQVKMLHQMIVPATVAHAQGPVDAHESAIRFQVDQAAESSGMVI
jgi:hypothetical protein